MRPLTRTLFAASGATVIVTVDGALAGEVPSVTVRLKVRSVFDVTAGAVNVGLTVFAPVSVTSVPAVWVHVYCRASPCGSMLASPLRRTGAPDRTVRLGPALAVSPAATTTGVAVTVAVAAFDVPPAPVQVSR